MLQPVELNLARIFVAINTLLRDTYTIIHQNLFIDGLYFCEKKHKAYKRNCSKILQFLKITDIHHF